MKIAIPVEKEVLFEHFGRSPFFSIFDIEDGKIKKKETVENPGHSTGFIPKFLSDLNVDTVIVGGVGMRAKEYFNEYNINLVTGAQGSVEEVVKAFLAGTLECTETDCVKGSGKGYGIDKQTCDHEGEI